MARKADPIFTVLDGGAKRAMEVIDAYDSEKVSQFLTSPLEMGTAGLMDMFPDMPGDSLFSGLKDATNIEWMSKNGLGFTDLIKGVMNALPNGVTLPDLIKGRNLTDILSFATGLKDFLPGDKWGGLNLSVFTDAFDAFQRYKAMGKSGIVDYFKGIAFGKMEGLFGTDNLNFLFDAAHKFGITKWMLQSGLTKDLISWLAGSSLPDWLKEIIFADLIAIAAGEGLYEFMAEAIANAKQYWNAWRKAETIISMLKGFRIPDGASRDQYPTIAKEFVDRLFSLDGGWLYYNRDGANISTTRYMVEAEYDALEIMKYDERTKWATVAFLSSYPEIVSWKTSAKEHFPLLYI